jgi:hypothetical protein
VIAPFGPELMSEPVNLLVAVLLGTAFGVVLEQAGFSSSRRLAGVFYGYDLTVLRVFFTAAITAMSGLLLLGDVGVLDLDSVVVNPTWLAPAIVGGVIMGVGFIVGGYCPGTSACAAAIGKVDAWFFIGGGVVGVLAFAEAFPFYAGFYGSTSLGPVKVFESLGLSEGVFALLLTGGAVAAFAAATWVERRVAGPSAPSWSFAGKRHMVAGVFAVAVAIALLFLRGGSPQVTHATDAGRQSGTPSSLGVHDKSL